MSILVYCDCTSVLVLFSCFTCGLFITLFINTICSKISTGICPCKACSSYNVLLFMYHSQFFNVDPNHLDFFRVDYLTLLISAYLVNQALPENI